MGFSLANASARPRMPSNPARVTINGAILALAIRSPRSEEHTSELQSHSDLHSFPTRRSSDPDGLLVGERQRQAPDAEQPRQGYDKRRHLGLGDQEPVAETYKPAHQRWQDQGERPGDLHSEGSEYATQAHHRSDRQVDTAAYD